MQTNNFLLLLLLPTNQRCLLSLKFLKPGSKRPDVFILWGILCEWVFGSLTLVSVSLKILCCLVVCMPFWLYFLRRMAIIGVELLIAVVGPYTATGLYEGFCVRRKWQFKWNNRIEPLSLNKIVRFLGRTSLQENKKHPNLLLSDTPTFSCPTPLPTPALLTWDK